MAVFTESERVEVWDRRHAGESNRSIGRRLGRSAASIRRSWKLRVGCGPQSGTGRCGTCRSLSARRSRVVLLQANRCV